MLWLEMAAIDAEGKTHSLTVNKKGFKGEEYTISDRKALAYQAMGEIMEIKNSKGIKRDGNIPDGVRIFRRPFFDPKGRMTICQWYTAENSMVDYRIGPRETKIETYSWEIPQNMSPGPVKITATLCYSLVLSSVAGCCALFLLGLNILDNHSQKWVVPTKQCGLIISTGYMS